MIACFWQLIPGHSIVAPAITFNLQRILEKQGQKVLLLSKTIQVADRRQLFKLKELQGLEMSISHLMKNSDRALAVLSSRSSTSLQASIICIIIFPQIITTFPKIVTYWVLILIIPDNKIHQLKLNTVQRPRYLVQKLVRSSGLIVVQLDVQIKFSRP